MHKRRLAASFIATMVVACTPPAREPEVPPVVHNPPAPVVEPDPDATGLPAAPTNQPGRLVHSGEQCYWEPSSDDEGHEVRCPAGTVHAPADADVQRRDDGTCFYYPDTPPQHCPEDMNCNPPRPVAVDVLCRGKE